MNTSVAVRHTAEERREEILAVAVGQFAATGLHGTSTEKIAREAGVSQPYVFRLFGTKKELFIASVRWAFAETLRAFSDAARDAAGPHDAFRRIGNAYMVLLKDQRYLGIQMQAYASCDDPEIREVVQDGFGTLVMEVHAATGAAPDQLSRFFGNGMLLNVTMSMGVVDQETGWPAIIREGCIGGFDS